MRYQRLLIAFVFAFCFGGVGFGQCPPTNTILELSSQSDIDSFLINSPDCTTYSGNVYLDNDPSFIDPIVNLNAFQNLNTVDGFFTVFSCDSLVNLNGLENLSSVGDYLKIHSNYKLENLNGLESLSSIGG